MSKPMLGPLGIGFLLLGTIFVSVLSEHSQAQVVALSNDDMAQLIGGTDERRASFESGTDDPDTLNCPPTWSGCSGTDWEKRKYWQCVACSYGQTKYTPTPDYWYQRFHECIKQSGNVCQERISQESTTTVCNNTSGTCL